MILFNNSQISSTTDGNTIVQNTVNEYTTEITDIVKDLRGSVVTVESGKNGEVITSGFVYAVDGDNAYIFTDLKGLEKESDIAVLFDSGASVDASLVGSDSDTGLALLKVTPGFEVTAVSQGDSDVITQGDYAVALGGRREDTDAGSVSFGVISQPGSMKTDNSTAWRAQIIAADASVNSENEGGPLVNINGELLGMLIDDPAGAAEDTGYAIAVNEMKDVYAQLVASGTAARGNPEITVRSMSSMKSYEKSQRNISLDQDTGVLVVSIDDESVSSGILNEGDIITSADGDKVKDVTDWLSKLYAKKPGDEIKLVVSRDGSDIAVSVVLK